MSFFALTFASLPPLLPLICVIAFTHFVSLVFAIVFALLSRRYRSFVALPAAVLRFNALKSVLMSSSNTSTSPL
jgi:hypothetical protein